MSKAVAISLDDAFAKLTFRGDRTPRSTDMDAAFCTLSGYRDGGVFLAHYAGNSEWERHPKGDELVFVVEGETNLVLLEDGQQRPNLLRSGELLIVPKDTWHRFESPNAVKILTVTPQPTDHSIELPR